MTEQNHLAEDVGMTDVEHAVPVNRAMGVRMPPASVVTSVFTTPPARPERLGLVRVVDEITDIEEVKADPATVKEKWPSSVLPKITRVVHMNLIPGSTPAEVVFLRSDDVSVGDVLVVKMNDGEEVVFSVHRNSDQHNKRFKVNCVSLNRDNSYLELIGCDDETNGLFTMVSEDGKFKVVFSV